MELMLFGALLVIAVVLYALGKTFGAVAFVGIAGIVMLSSGYLVVIDGMSYDQMNATAVNYSYSSGYFEFTNDTVTCNNCTNASISNTSCCCEHDLNTSISGIVSENSAIGYESISLDIEWARIMGLILVLVGLVSILDASMSFRREMKERGSMF